MYFSPEQLRELQAVYPRDLSGEVFCIQCQRYTIHGVCECTHYVLPFAEPPMADKPKKGEWGGECNRTACHNPEAVWFNVSTRKHYCGMCARTLNEVHEDQMKDLARRYPGQEDLQGLLCILREHPE